MPEKISLEVLLSDEVRRLLDSCAAAMKIQVVFYSRDGRILRHYTCYALMIGIIGSALGIGIVLMILGARYNIALMIVQYILPSAVMTGGFCILVHLIMKPVLTHQSRPGMDKHIGSSK